jgi:hypothetical protein
MAVRALRKLNPGETLPVLPRDTFNTIIDSRDVIGRHKNNLKSRVPLLQNTGGIVVLVKNDSGSDVDRFGVLGIEEPIILPDENENEFAMRVALRCVEPSEGESSGSSDTDHRGKFVITAEPIANGKIGRAFVAGVCACKLDDVTAEGDFAEIIAGDTEHLQIATTGSAVILWKETASGGQWAIIRFGGGSGGASFSLVRQYTIPIAVADNVIGGDFLIVGNPES